MDRTQIFETERPRLRRVAARVLGDEAEAEDVVQDTWLRLHRAGGSDEGGDAIANLPGWLTTVTTRLCLDRLRARSTAVDPVTEVEVPGAVPDPAEGVAQAEAVGGALQVVLDRLGPAERVALVLHDSFGVEFSTVAAVLGSSPEAARKHASRARAKIGRPQPEQDAVGRPADWEVVDAFMVAAKEGDFARLLQLLAPGVAVRADRAAAVVGTPERIDGRGEVAAFFDGSAHAALPVFLGGRPGAAWFDRGRAMVLFDFVVADGQVQDITFRAEPAVLDALVRRSGGTARA